MSNDPINHPTHYTFGKHEVIDIAEDWGLDKDAYLFNVFTYVARARHKGQLLEDLKKARWYLDRRIKQLEEVK